jgi:hypothetical protein
MLDDPVLSPGRPRSLAAALNAEWRRLCRDPRTARRLARWPLPPVAPTDPAGLLAAVGREGGLDPGAADTMLAAVVRIAADDDVAARIVLQRVIGALVLVAVRRTRERPADRQRLFDDLVATAWMVIRTYPSERRPAKIAVNIVRDAEYLTCVRPRRLRSASEVPTLLTPGALGTCRLDGRPAGQAEPAAELAELLSLGLAAGVDRTNLAMVAQVHLLGRSVEDVARQYRITSRTLRNRRKAVTRELAALVA